MYFKNNYVEDLEAFNVMNHKFGDSWSVKIQYFWYLDTLKKIFFYSKIGTDKWYQQQTVNSLLFTCDYCNNVDCLQKRSADVTSFPPPRGSSTHQSGLDEGRKCDIIDSILGVGWQ